jgi:ABC-2 type transport system permease protein
MAWDKLYGERLGTAYRTGIRYMMLAISGNNLFGIILLLVGAAIGYRFLLDWMAPSPYSIAVLIALYSWLAYRVHIRTFLRNADLALLVPTPYPKPRYINHALWYSVLIQCVQFSIWAMVLWPAVVRTGGQATSLAFILVGAAALKVWNSVMHWRTLGLADRSIRSALQAIWRFMLNALFWYGLFAGIPLIGVIAGVFMLISWILIKQRSAYVPWMRLVEAERQKVRAYYTWLNWFVDIPYTEPEVKPRKSWVRLWSMLFGKHHSAMLFLLARSWVRTGDEFGMFVRLTMVGAILLAVIEWPWAVYLVFVGTPLLAGYVMVQWARLSSEPSFVRIMPIDIQQKRRAFAHLCSFALILQIVVLSIAFLIFHGWSLRTMVLIVAVILWCFILGRLVYPRKAF